MKYEFDDEDLNGGFAEDGDASISDYRDLEVWKEGMVLATSIYKATASFPVEERYGITSQMRRAAVSIPANVAEGYGRSSTGAYVHFLKISLGSAKELETLIELSRRLELLKAPAADQLQLHARRLSKMLHSLGRSVEAQRKR